MQNNFNTEVSHLARQQCSYTNVAPTKLSTHYAIDIQTGGGHLARQCFHHMAAKAAYHDIIPISIQRNYDDVLLQLE